MDYKDLEAILQVVVQNINEGIYIVRADGQSIVYNERMSRLEKTEIEDVLGKNVRIVQSHIPDEESSLIKALEHKKATLNYYQTFVNQYGKEITTVNTTIPVLGESGNVVAAVEIARDVTDIKDMSNLILDLRNETLHKEKEIVFRGLKYSFDKVVGVSESIKEILNKAKKASKTGASVLIYGETGTGKELIAQSIHNESIRRNKPFIAQNCAALPESLMEGIMFGTAKGGFTGAIDRAGIFEQANGGTLLLDEISTMPYNLQSKLLRVLQEGTIRRIGGSKDIPVDVRIIATINEKAEDLIEKNKLRQDLYYRLKIIEINISPLRERREDILPLARYFLKIYGEEAGKPPLNFSKEVEELLINYDYPGNTRELQHIIMAGIYLGEDKEIFGKEQLELPEDPIYKTSSYIAEDLKERGLAKYIDNIEKELIKEALESSRMKLANAAKLLGISRQNLQYKLKKHNIQIED